MDKSRANNFLRSVAKRENTGSFMKVVFDKEFSVGVYHWNHRVVRRVFHPGTDKEQVDYAIHEAHYNEKGASSGRCSITLDPVAVSSSEGLEGLRWVLTKMLEALDKPVLDYETREEINQARI